jgi:hypothetical protein
VAALTEGLISKGDVIAGFAGATHGHGAGQEVQLDEAARVRLDRMNRRLRLLEQQMETLEAELGRASAADNSYE